MKTPCLEKERNKDSVKYIKNTFEYLPSFLIKEKGNERYIG